MNWDKTIKRIVMIFLALLVVGCACLVVWEIAGQSDTVERFEQAAPRNTEDPGESDRQIDSAWNTGAGTDPDVELVSYQSPVDFPALQEVNPDIYAWLEIPGADISYPLLQHKEEDAYYLTHDAEGNRNVNGALYTERTYNDIAFQDPVTLIYGHNMTSGFMFGRLQEYFSDAESFREYHEIIIYLPDRELHFEVFAAVPFDHRHIMYSVDFSDESAFDLFFQDVLSIQLEDAQFADDASVQPGDQVIILSTCLIGDRTKRFLVCAKLSPQLSAE